MEQNIYIAQKWIGPHMVNLLTLKSSRIDNEERIVFSKNCFGENWRDTYKIVELDAYLTPHTKINPEWMENLNTSPGIIKLPEENIEWKFFVMCLGIDFLGGLTTKATNKRKILISKWDYINLKKHLHSTGNQNYQQNEKGMYRIAGNICKSYIW